MQRILPSLAPVSVLVAVLAFCPAAQAQTTAADPIGDLIAKVLSVFDGPAMKLKATLYHVGAKGVGNRDSLGCAVSPMRTLAVDPRYIPRRTMVYIEETVGITMPDGTRHDGIWYASDTGGKIKGGRIDLFTGSGKASMREFYKRNLNLGILTAVKIGAFRGCPPR